MKAASGKFSPLQQWLYFAAEEVLVGGGEQPMSLEETAPRGSRYDAQAAVLGWTKQTQLSALRYLLVGAGACGCEGRWGFPGHTLQASNMPLFPCRC